MGCRGFEKLFLILNPSPRADFAVGNITYEDVLTVQPFDNTVDLASMTGAGILATLETMAAGIDYDDMDIYPGFGYQVAGLKFNITVGQNNVNNRISGLQALSINDLWVHVDPEKVIECF